MAKDLNITGNDEHDRYLNDLDDKRDGMAPVLLVEFSLVSAAKFVILGIPDCERARSNTSG